jgi:hypothetical protein
MSQANDHDGREADLVSACLPSDRFSRFNQWQRTTNGRIEKRLAA